MRKCARHSESLSVNRSNTTSHTSDLLARRTGRVAAALPDPGGSTGSSADAIPMPGPASATGGSQYGVAIARSLSNVPVPTLSQTSSQSRKSSRVKRGRERSPTTTIVRTPAGLRLAQIPVIPVALGDTKQISASLLGLLDSSRLSSAAEPPSQHGSSPRVRYSPLQEPEIEQAWLVGKEEYPVEEHLLTEEFEQPKYIATFSEECSLEGSPEVVWNESVQSRLRDITLRLVGEGSDTATSPRLAFTRSTSSR